MLRLVFRFTVAALLGLVVLLLSYPVWLPWVLSGLGPGQGLTVGSYDRKGYFRLELEDVHLIGAGFELNAAKVSLPVWPLWVLRRETDRDSGAQIRVEQWRLALVPLESAEGSVDGSVAAVHRQISEILPGLQRLLPIVQAQQGLLLAGDREIVVEQVRWSDPVLSAVLGLPDQPWRVRASLDLRPGHPWALDLKAEPWDASVSAVLSGSSDRLEVALGLQWRTSALSGRMEFGASGYLPEQARLQSETLSIDPQLLGTDRYGPITGVLAFTWTNSRFAAEADLKSNPKSEAPPNLPPLTAGFEVVGGLDGTRLERLDLEIPWASARLSEPIDLRFGPGFREQAADLDFEIDLAASPLPATGRVTGRVNVTTAEGKVPSVTASLAVADLGLEQFSGLQAEAVVRLEYPRLEIGHLSIGLAADSGGSFEGEADLAERTLKGDFLAWTAGGILGAYLPDGVAFSEFVLAGTLEGPWSAPVYSVRGMTDELDLPGFLPVSGEAQLQGCGPDLDHARVMIANETAELQLQGALKLGTADRRATLTGLRLSRKGTTVLETARGSQVTSDLRSRVDGDLRLEGQSGHLALRGGLDWPASAGWWIEVENLKSNLLEGLLEWETGGLDLAMLESEGSWNEGPVRFTASSTGRVLFDEERVGFRARVGGDGSWLSIDEMVVASDDRDVLRATGRLPVILTPAAETRIAVDWDRAVDLRMETFPNPAFWNRVGNLAGVDLRHPELQIDLTGIAAAPVGKLAFSASALNLRRSENEVDLPPITALSLNAELTADRAVLENGRMQVEGESVSIEGELPLRPEDWLQLAFDRKWPDWNQATVRLRAADARIAAIVPYLPTILTPSGRLDLDLTLRPDRQLSGFLVLEDAALRPIRPFGALQEIQARIDFEGQHIRCDQVVAVVGGQKVTLTGAFDWGAAGNLAYDFTLKGTRVPLFREPGLVIRSDLDLRLKGSGAGAAVLSGNLGLSDSLFVADLNRLLSGSVDSPSRRPPYFSVEAEPFNRWGLDLRLTGPEFLRVETPVFKGLLSADFALTGTLREPKAVGELRVDRGSVEFPFATLRMSSGTLSIREDNPFDVGLDLEAGSRVFGFDISMRVEGYATAPRLLFESEPSLGSDAVLLMLTTGEVPNRSGYYSVQQRLTKLAVYLGRNLLVEFGLGGGAENRFIIQSGSDISLKGRETYEVEILLNDELSLVGGYDEFDAYNGGVKWRVYSK